MATGDEGLRLSAWHVLGVVAFTLLTAACGAAIYVVWVQTPVDAAGAAVDAPVLTLAALAALEAALVVAVVVCWRRLFQALDFLGRVRRV